MKLSDNALLEIVNIFQRGVLLTQDVSQDLRDLRFEDEDGLLNVLKQEEEKE